MNTSAEIGEQRPRYFWAAGLLALLTPGLGLLYCGKARAGLSVLAFAILLWIINALTGDPTVKISLVLLYYLFHVAQIVWSAVLAARIGKGYRLQRFNRLVAYGLLFMLFAAYNQLDSVYLTEISAISTRAMEPAIERNDLLIINKLAPRLSAPNLGDVVVYLHNDKSRVPFIGRILAGPRDEVRLEHGRYTVNGRSPESLVSQAVAVKTTATGLQEMPPVLLGQGEFFIVGDKQLAAYDSRFSGPVRADWILGRVDAILYSGRTGAPLFGAKP